MKHSAFTVATLLLLLASACNKSELEPPVTLPDPNANKFAGVYSGIYEATYNGASNDSGGVFKHDTSYYYSITIAGEGADSISIEKGVFNINTIAVINNSFQLIYHNHKVFGQFVNDSLYVHSKALTGLYDPDHPVLQWFGLQTLNFKGKKIY